MRFCCERDLKKVAGFYSQALGMFWLGCLSLVVGLVLQFVLLWSVYASRL